MDPWEKQFQESHRKVPRKYYNFDTRKGRILDIILGVLGGLCGLVLGILVDGFYLLSQFTILVTFSGIIAGLAVSRVIQIYFFKDTEVVIETNESKWLK